MARRGFHLLGRFVAGAALAGCTTSTVETRYQALTDFYERTGRMRTETAPRDAPFDNEDLVRNFESIAFHTEFARSDELTAERTPTKLLKWEGEVRWQLEGDGATKADAESYRRLTARLEGLTGLEFVETDENPHVFILIAGDELREVFIETLRERDVLDRMRLIEEWSRNDVYPCVGQIGHAGEGEDRRQQAMIVIKAETRGLLRESCIHEELVQALGLLNDDERARPSIFNDDQEFALLTTHDEYLLRILYDPRLEPGMTAQEGMPIVRRIVEEIGPGEGDGDGGGGEQS